jgi:two-component system, NtrC family, response regulator AtoC
MDGRDFHIFKGIEADISADGNLDYPDAVLKCFDFIIASIHSRFKMDRDMQTTRILHAIRAALGHEVPDLILLDLKMPGLSGLETFKKLHAAAPQILVIIMTAYGTVKDAVDAMKLGVYDFLIKTVEFDGMDPVVDRAVDLLNLRWRLDMEKEHLGSQYGLSNLVAHSPAMQQILLQVQSVTANAKSSVLLLGETGTGKEFLARVLHCNGPRASGPFIGVNCTAIPKELFESELFGYERGAFTGAVQRKLGLIEKAEEMGRV